MPRTLNKELLTANHICEAIITALKPDEKLKRTMEGRANQAERILVESMKAGSKHVLVIEEAAHAVPVAEALVRGWAHAALTQHAPDWHLALLAHPRIARTQGSELLADIKVVGLDGHREGHLHPPVTGGKNATSQPSSKVAEGSHSSWLRAMRTARFAAKASA